MAKKLGEVLRQARLDAGLSLRDLQRLTGMPTSQLSQIESGTRADPAFTTIARIAKGIGISLDTIEKRCIGPGSDSETVQTKKDLAVVALADLERAKRAALQAVSKIDHVMIALTNDAKDHKRRRPRKH